MAQGPQDVLGAATSAALSSSTPSSGLVGVGGLDAGLEPRRRWRRGRRGAPRSPRSRSAWPASASTPGTPRSGRSTTARRATARSSARPVSTARPRSVAAASSRRGQQLGRASGSARRAGAAERRRRSRTWARRLPSRSGRGLRRATYGRLRSHRGAAGPLDRPDQVRATASASSLGRRLDHHPHERLGAARAHQHPADGARARPRRPRCRRRWRSRMSGSRRGHAAR